MIWQFKINGVEVEEPVGWDAVAITLTRSTDYWGLENIYSDNIIFWDSGAEIIRGAYELDGIDADLEFEANYDCGDGAGFVTFVSGILNCYFYQIVNNQVTVKIEPSGFHRDIKNNIDTTINLLSTKSIDDSEMSAFAPFDFGLHSKNIVTQGSTEANTFINPYEEDITATRVIAFFAMQAKTDEFAATDGYGIQDVGILFDDASIISPPHVIDPIFIVPFDGDYTFTWDFDVDFVVSDTINDFSFLFTPLAYSVGQPATTPITEIIAPILYASHHDPISFKNKHTGSITLTLVKNDRVAFFQQFFEHASDPYYDHIKMVTNVATFTIKTNSVFAPSACKAFLVHEVFAILAESMTGVKDCFRSDYFGQPNSFPHQYDSAGCGAWAAITNGLAIRQLLDQNGNLYNISTTFQDFFQNIDAIYNIGMRVQMENGKEILRIEPKEYFFNSNQIFTVLNVSDLNKAPAVEYIYNTFDNGYDKWNLNITGSNAIDEFNSQHSYTLPLRMSNTGLIKISKLIASGYLIEQTRRLQFNSYPTNDFETDNDLFIICTNRTEIISDKYKSPPVPTVYPAGTVSERDENFTDITNVLNSASNYNYRISPTRMAANWYKWLSGSIFKHPDQPIRFVSGQGNYLEADTMINDCVTTASVIQNQDLLKSDISLLQSVPIFNPEYLTFTYPISFEQYTIMLANAEKAIGVSCSSGAQYVGFILTAKYGMNANGSFAEFKILTSGQCISGDFNNDFNHDFFKGNC